MTDTTILEKPAAAPHSAKFPKHSPIPAVSETPAPAPRRVLEALNNRAETTKAGSLTRCHYELQAGAALEQKVWIALSLCSAVTILYAFYSFFLHP